MASAWRARTTYYCHTCKLSSSELRVPYGNRGGISSDSNEESFCLSACLAAIIKEREREELKKRIRSLTAPSEVKLGSYAYVH